MNSKVTADHFARLDIWAEVERHTSTRLKPFRSGKQASGACPFGDCSVDTDGFTVWPELTDKGRHYYCRGCRRSGNIIDLLMQLRGYTFNQACAVLDIDNPYRPGGSSPSPSREPGQAAPPRTRKQAAPTPDWRPLCELYPRAKLALQRARPRAYLAARGVPFELAQLLGYGYIPPLEDINVTPALRAIEKWTDHLIVPLSSPAGQGFNGRTLHYWQEGMDEHAHRDILKQHGTNPYEKTYPAGLFHAGALKEGAQHLTIVEGVFDATALLAAGIEDAIALCGTSLDVQAIPLQVCDVTLALDGDGPGREAAQKLARELRRKGITPRICPPPADGQGKDWSERYRKHGKEGLAALFVSASELNLSKACPAGQDLEDFTCCVCGTDLCNPEIDSYIDEAGQAYCSPDWQARQRGPTFTSYEHFTDTVRGLADRLGEQAREAWTVTLLPQGYTHQDHIARLQAQARERYKAAIAANREQAHMKAPRARL